MRSRIAIFEGYKSPFGNRPPQRAYTRIPASMDRYGAPLFNNPRLSDMGRRGYYVAPQYVAAQGEGPGVYEPRVKRKGYKVKAKRTKVTAAMRKARAKFRKAAKSCSRRRKGSFQTCMKKALKKSRKSKR